MRRFAFVSLLPVFLGAQTITLTSPSAGTISGNINLTSSVSSAPSTEEVDYVWNDYYVIARIQRSGDAAWTYRYNSGWLLDGKGWIKAVAKDISGNTLASSGETAVTINNFGIAWTWNSPNVNAPTINLSGTVTFDWTTSQPAANIVNCQCSVDGVEFHNFGGCYETGAFAVPLDTTTLLNGLHVFSCGGSQAGNPVQAKVSGSFVGNVQNGHTLMGVQPDIDEIIMTAGQTYQLNPVLYYTDGTTSAGTFTYSQKNACLLPDLAYQTPFPCANVTPSTPTAAVTDANGPNYATVSSTGLITASATLGHTTVIITDNASGKAAYVNVAVRQYQTVPHFGTDGTVLHSYDPAKSFFRLSLFNIPTYCAGLTTSASCSDNPMAMSVVGNDTLANHYAKARFNSYETNPWLTPHNVANTATYQSNFNTLNRPTLQKFAAAFPKMCVVMRGDGIFEPNGNLNNLDQGPSASWSPDPITFVVGAVRNVVQICGFEIRDEADQGFTNFNPTASLKVADGTISKVIAKNGSCTVYSGATTQPVNSWFPGMTRWGGAVQVNNPGGSKAGLSGAMDVTHEWCSSWNIYYHGVCPVGESGTYPISAGTNANPPVFTFNGRLNPATPAANAGFTTTGGTVLISGATGNWTPSNGIQTVANVDGTHFSVPALNSATWGALTGTVNFQPITLQPVSSFDMACPSVADGTYNNLAVTDPNLEIQVSALTPYYNSAYDFHFAGDPAIRNSMWTNISARLTALNVPHTWPVLGAADSVTHLTFEGPQMSSYLSRYNSNSETGMNSTTFPWGWGYAWARLTRDYQHWQTLPTSYGTPSVWYWLAQSNGHAFKPQEVPWVDIMPIELTDYNAVGRSINITSFAGAILTTATAHGLKSPGVGPQPFHLATISGNTDSAVNTTNSGHWKLGSPLSATTVEVFSSSPGKAGCLPTGGVSATVTIRGNTYTATGIGNPGTFFYLTLTTPAPADLISGEHITVSGLTGGNVCGNDTYAFDSFFRPPSTTILQFAQFANSTGTGGTIRINDSEELPNPTVDLISHYFRPWLFQPDGIYEASSGMVAGLREYSIAVGAYGIDATLLYPGYACGVACQQVSGLPFASAPLDMQRNWWALTHTNALIQRAAPFWLQTIQPAPRLSQPFIHNGGSNSKFNTGGWASCHAQSSSFGKSLTCVNTSESATTITVDHTLRQTGANPISVYRMIYPKLDTDLLSGAQATQSYTLDAGESIVFLYHSGTSSYVIPVPFSFTLGSAAKMAVRYSYGYPGPLREAPAQVVCTTSPCLVNLDPSLHDIWYQLVFLDVNNVQLSVSDPQMIAPH